MSATLTKETTGVEGAVATHETDEVPTRKRTDKRPNLRWWIVVMVFAAVAIAGATLTYIFHVERGDVGASVDDSSIVTKVASDGAVAILSYKPDTVDADLLNAKQRLTGDFLDYYSKFTTTVVAPAAKEKKVATTATVPAAGAVSVSDSRAVVLVMVNQQTTTAEAPNPASSASSVRVELVKNDGRWLISKFDPV
ncbi:twin-arginine translocation pathway signal [Williamsia sp. R60]